MRDRNLKLALPGQPGYAVVTNVAQYPEPKLLYWCEDFLRPLFWSRKGPGSAYWPCLAISETFGFTVFASYFDALLAVTLTVENRNRWLDASSWGHYYQFLNKREDFWIVRTA